MWSWHTALCPAAYYLLMPIHDVYCPVGTAWKHTLLKWEGNTSVQVWSCKAAWPWNCEGLKINKGINHKEKMSTWIQNLKWKLCCRAEVEIFQMNPHEADPRISSANQLVQSLHHLLNYTWGQIICANSFMWMIIFESLGSRLAGVQQCAVHLWMILQTSLMGQFKFILFGKLCTWI